MKKEEIIDDIASSPNFIITMQEHSCIGQTATHNIYKNTTTVYTKRVEKNNKWGLKIFKDEAGHGYIVEETITKHKRTNMTTQKKKKKTVTVKPISGKKKKAAGKKKTGLNKPTVPGLTTVCVKVVKADGLKKDGTLKKGHRYVKGGGIVKTVAKKK
ncbi:hypothetical protein [Flavobacterium sp. UBA4197]|uniref:hypothetical protein n=1 Tax=Flavobacterium sp. UBA4197 TaxID=1946546 RepID=UPI00257CAFBD|nr:hypothetical protein [Flavobacterium sp. UBA4197]HRB72448.1 hypothetical protein [Flavobacterium sp.]